MAVAGALGFPNLRAGPPSDPLLRWELRYPVPPDLGDVVFVEDTFVGVPASGTGPPFISEDGLNWRHAWVEGDTWRAGFSDVGYGDGRFVGVTRAGWVFVSVDAANWTALSFAPVADGATNRLVHVAAGNSVIVTATAEDGIATSRDGLTWQFAPLLYACPRRLWFGNGTFLVVGTCGPAREPAIWTSKDGVTWTTPADPLGQRIRDVSFSDGLFTAVSSDDEVLTSTDGLNWAVRGRMPVGSADASAFVIYGKGRFVSLEVDLDGEMMAKSSLDGANWSAGTNVGAARGLVYGNGLFLVSGRDTFVSPDGFTWTRSGNSGVHPTSIAFGNGAFVAAGGHQLLHSTDGTNWRPVSRPETQRVPAGVYFVNGMFIGPTWPSFDPASVAQLDGALLISRDGLTWTEHVGPPMLSSLRSIVYGNGAFVAIGEGNRLFRSTNGIHWFEQAEVEFLTQVVFGNGRFLASAELQTSPRTYDTIIYGSSDGLVWRRLSTLQNQLVTLATFASSVFVAQSLDGPRRNVLTSRDGIDWTTAFVTRNPGIIPPAYATSASGMIVLLSPFMVVSSDNGLIWTEQPVDSPWTIADETLHPAMAYGRGTFVTVAGGNVQQSGPVPPTYWVSVVANQSMAREPGSEAGRFYVTREGSTSAETDLKVNIRIGGTAVNGLDYSLIEESVLIPAGQMTASVLITPRDVIDFNFKTVELTVLPGPNYRLGDPDLATITLGPRTGIDITSVVRLQDGTTRLRIDSRTASTLVVEASVDLINWFVLKTLSVSAGAVEFIDTDMGGWQRFYRVRSAIAPTFGTAVDAGLDP